MLAQLWKFVYEHKRYSFLHHVVEFRLSCTPLNNLNIKLPKIFCPIIPIVFGKKPSLNGIKGRIIIGFWDKTFLQIRYLSCSTLRNMNENLPESGESYEVWPMRKVSILREDGHSYWKCACNLAYNEILAVAENKSRWRYFIAWKTKSLNLMKRQEHFHKTW